MNIRKVRNLEELKFPFWVEGPLVMIFDGVGAGQPDRGGAGGPDGGGSGGAGGQEGGEDGGGISKGQMAGGGGVRGWMARNQMGVGWWGQEGQMAIAGGSGSRWRVVGGQEFQMGAARGQIKAASTRLGGTKWWGYGTWGEIPDRGWGFSQGWG